MKTLLAESLAHAHALLAQNPENMFKYWKPLEVAFDRDYQDAITPEEIERIFSYQVGKRREPTDGDEEVGLNEPPEDPLNDMDTDGGLYADEGIKCFQFFF